MMQRAFLLFFLLAILAVPWPAEAVRFHPTPSCTADAFVSCTDGLCVEAEAANAIVLSPFATTADVTASNGNYRSLPIGTHWPARMTRVGPNGQFCARGSFATGTYYLWLLARVPSTANNLVWVDTAPIPLIPDNAKATVLFNGQAQQTFAWATIGAFNTLPNFRSRTVAVAQRAFSLVSGSVLYLTTAPDVHIDALFVSTNANATPTTGDGGTGPANYEIYELGAKTVVIDGTCESDPWGQANTVQFRGFSDLSAATTAKFLWKTGTPSRLYGCVTQNDTNVQAATTASDNTAIFNDDYLEMIFSDNLDRVWGTKVWKFAINPHSTQAHLDARADAQGNFDNGQTLENRSKARAVSGTLNNSSDTDTSWTVEFVFDMPCTITAGNVKLFDLLIQNVPGGAYKQAVCTNPTTFNDPACWGTVKYLSTVVPSPPADTVGPVVTAVSDLNVTSNSFDVRATVSDAFPSLPITCKVRYGTSTGSYPNTTAVSTAVGGQCTAMLTGLQSSTTYFYRYDATDAANNTTTVAERTQATSAPGATFYVSPAGSGTTCSSASPCAISRLAASADPRPDPGETWLLKDGTYTNPGVLIDCASGSLNGTAAQPITVKAENERQAFISGDGITTPLILTNCAYWRLEGLRLEAADAANQAGEPLNVTLSNNIQLKRLLLARNNRYANAHLFLLSNSTNILVEDSELYYFHRHAILNWYTDNSIYRRIYCHSRGYEDIPGGAASGAPDRGDGCLSIYPGNSNILENVISEGNYQLTEINALDTNVGNHVLGSISLDDYTGAIPNARGFTLQFMPRDVIFQDFVVIRPLWYGLKSEAGKNIQCNGCTVLNAGFDGFNVTDAQGYGDGSQSFFATNTLVVNSRDYGFFIVNQGDWGIDYANAFGNGTNYSPTNGKITNSTAIDPQLGSARVCIPRSSPMAGSGSAGKDKGANVLYRYEAGVLTTSPLWTQTKPASCPANTNGWYLSGMGACVAGMNDSVSNSLVGIADRLNVTTAILNSCEADGVYP